ncbi:uncharacterized protein LOC116842056 isoform X1 [Odontomachus brunneus]|uniref:uncharacterized protein LOC116842056 isoform X1 n=1 Tax=Odontomachus brunneus TaxID=486640 RepID=UPI0013F1A532|nr:uncharacterized protein LOC116842056 isoform X1 [Odontomachus brunneus]XP_032666601.1 uncharacterized protein LOC116842056 isoform X1 [Odontomachus brunneus]XP_032666602.1 uncharacterized protein LOC116842056 isoform X1 [Odontomachus brunneus]
MTVLCVLWATLSTVASILACSGFYLPYWIQLLGHTERLVASKHGHDGDRRRGRSDRRPHTLGGGLVVPAAHPEDAQAHEDPWLLAIARCNDDMRRFGDVPDRLGQSGGARVLWERSQRLQSRKVLGVLVDSFAGRFGGVADAVLRPELLRGPTQALEFAHGPPAHLTIEILPVDSRLRLAEDDHALHRHGLLIVPGAVAAPPCACVSMRERGCRRRPSTSPAVAVAPRNQIHYTCHRAYERPLACDARGWPVVV